MKDYTGEMLLASAVIVGLGAVSGSDMPNLNMIFGAAVVAIFISVFAKIDTRIGNGIAFLILFGVSVKYLVQGGLLEKLGIMGSQGIRPYKGLPSKTAVTKPDPPAVAPDPGAIPAPATPQNSGGFQI